MARARACGLYGREGVCTHLPVRVRGWPQDADLISAIERSHALNRMELLAGWEQTSFEALASLRRSLQPYLGEAPHYHQHQACSIHVLNRKQCGFHCCSSAWVGSEPAQVTCAAAPCARRPPSAHARPSSCVPALGECVGTPQCARLTGVRC
jgi:hypothetical protein